PTYQKDDKQEDAEAKQLKRKELIIRVTNKVIEHESRTICLNKDLFM
ncbi:282_t:CDS:2, partial [Gigaspora rosea]